jgi:hypothetical protein
MQDFFGQRHKLLFVPYALQDHDGYVKALLDKATPATSWTAFTAIRTPFARWNERRRSLSAAATRFACWRSCIASICLT